MKDFQKLRTRRNVSKKLNLSVAAKNKVAASHIGNQCICLGILKVVQAFFLDVCQGYLQLLRNPYFIKTKNGNFKFRERISRQFVRHCQLFYHFLYSLLKNRAKKEKRRTGVLIQGFKRKKTSKFERML